ncbi:Fic/DOC family protein [Methyloferula stellata]|uniref:Fic/DOC family protein n=1 Tax=Methyloferula stellata TaxID=876270 RepID=UPI00037466C2|nr:Fic family protein [Methyloferula stellata]
MPNYTYTETGVLKNKFGIQIAAKLRPVEAAFVAARRIEIEAGHGPKPTLDSAYLKGLHQHLFQDVYEWAGRTRGEKVTLSDGTVASETEFNKADGKDYLYARLLPTSFEQFDKGLRDNHFWRGSDRADFARAVTDIITDFTAMHPFRKGNGRTLRIFLRELAREAGHALDFSVISRERMRHAAISLHELDDTTFYRSLITELLDPERVAALKAAIAFFDAEKFPWNDYEIATPEPGQTAELVLTSVQGPYFIGHGPLQILVGKLSDLREPIPNVGDAFTLA